MGQAQIPLPTLAGFGATHRKDAWWAGPLLTLLGLLAVLLYAHYIVFFLARYFLYAAIVVLLFLAWDALYAFWWPTLDADGRPTGGHQLGMGLGTLIMWVNLVLLTGFTFGCNSLRHLVGGRLDCFSCADNVARERGGYKAWRFVTWFNEQHMLWAWLSLISVGFTDFYIRM